MSSELHKIKQRSATSVSGKGKGQPTSQNDIAILYSLISILYMSLPPEHVLQFWGAILLDLQPPQYVAIGSKDVLFMQAFLHLLSTMATSSVTVHLAISSNIQFCTILTLILLVPLEIPLELKGVIFNALATFCEPGAGVAGVDIFKDIWALIEQVEVINIHGPIFGWLISVDAVLLLVKGVKVELDEVKAVYKLYPATIPFLRLLAILLHTSKRLFPPTLLADTELLNTILEFLGQPYHLPGIGPYIGFMVNNVFTGLPGQEYFVECALAGWEIETLVRWSKNGLLN
ncbi:hypothetical protein HD554DRAFT_2041969 [Boletus coccyginus]|nr:hypothetical protein HD554DRAFT_2041969 [Boletus coccyginus]